MSEPKGQFRRRQGPHEENVLTLNISLEEYLINPVLFSESATMAAQRRVVNARVLRLPSMESLERAIAGGEGCT